MEVVSLPSNASIPEDSNALSPIVIGLASPKDLKLEQPNND